MARAFAKSFYNSKEWKDCREYIYNKFHGVCAECGEPGEEVHHMEWLTPENINDPNVTLNEDNLVLLCKNCHFLKHKESNPLAKSLNARKKSTSPGYYFDETGNLVPIKKYIVYGSPGSGKTTYVREHKEVGDLVVDLDLIKQAISMEGRISETDNLLDVAIGIRDYIYKRIEANDINTKTIWIIGSLPKKKQRNELADKLGAELILIDKTMSECLNNAYMDRTRENKDLEKLIINKWFANFER